MKLEITLGCAACGFSDIIHVDDSFDCDNIVCPKCRNDNCISIISVKDLLPSGNYQSAIQNLIKIRQL